MKRVTIIISSEKAKKREREIDETIMKLIKDNNISTCDAHSIPTVFKLKNYCASLITSNKESTKKPISLSKNI